ncbi:MAG: hypothetical protein ACK4TF_04230 [Thermodesulfovibrionales bacterium]
MPQKEHIFQGFLYVCSLLCNILRFNPFVIRVKFFNQGGGRGNTVLKPLGLSEEEKRYLRIFLEEALTGEEIVIKYPEIP